MRTGLLSELSVIGYEIYLEGETIRLRYKKPGHPPEKTVKALVEELKAHKAEAVAILKEANSNNSPYNVLPMAGTGAVWSREDQNIIDWFEEQTPPPTPFYQEPHIRVIDPKKYFAKLREEIAAGPTSPRGRNGALLHDLKTLKKILH
ncbi:MAG: hypothetical protein KA113_13670 [Syntrophaceae bacterium]|nr:hypothetical protein [Syntrophaceae bacterium]